MFDTLIQGRYFFFQQDFQAGGRTALREQQRDFHARRIRPRRKSAREARVLLGYDV